MKNKKYIIPLLIALGFISPLSFATAAGSADATTVNTPSVTEQIYDAEATLDANWTENHSMAQTIIDATLPTGKTVRVGIFPTGYTKPVKQDDGTTKYMPIYTYTTDGYNFYQTPNQAISPSWWQRLWAARKPSADKQISNIAKDIYNGKYNDRYLYDSSSDSKNRSRAATWIERGNFEKLLREYIKRRSEGKTPDQILAENSEFLDLVSINSQNPYADLIRDKDLFESGYQSYSGFNAFNPGVALPAQPIGKPAAVPVTPTKPAAIKNVLPSTPAIDAAKSMLTINGAPLPYGIPLTSLSIDPETGIIKGEAKSPARAWYYDEYSLTLNGTIRKDTDGNWVISAEYKGSSKHPVEKEGQYTKYTFRGTLNFKLGSMQDTQTNWSADPARKSEITILSSEAKGLPSSWQLLKGTYETGATLTLAGSLNLKDSAPVNPSKSFNSRAFKGY